MWRVLPLFLLLFSLLAQANSPFPLERRLSPFPQTAPDAVQAEQWQSQTDQLVQQAEAHRTLIQTYAERRAELETQLDQGLPRGVVSDQPLDQQSAMVHLQLQDLNDSISSLNQLSSALTDRLQALGEVEAQAQAQQQLAESQPESSEARKAYYRQLLETLVLERRALPLEQDLVQLRQRLVRRQLADLQARLGNINQAQIQARRAQSRDALISTLPGSESDPILSAISETNADLARQLGRVNGQLEQAAQHFSELELRFQKQATALGETNELLRWRTRDADFGATLIRQRNRWLAEETTLAPATQIGQSRIARYELEQAADDLAEQLAGASQGDPALPLWTRQAELLTQLQDAHTRLVEELTRLKLLQERFEAQGKSFAELINEHLFWLPNARPLDRQWLREIGLGLLWLLSPQRIEDLQQSYRANLDGWALWLLLAVLAIVSKDLLRSAYAKARENQSRYIGNVTMDRFTVSMMSLVWALAYSLLLPLPLWAGAYLLAFGDGPEFAQALGTALLSAMVPFQIFWLLHQLTRPDGLLVAHFRRYPPLIAKARVFLRKMLTLGLPPLILVYLTEGISLDWLQTGLGRAAFLVLCLVLIQFYRQLARYAEQYHFHHSRGGRNLHTMNRLIWWLMIGLPFAALLLTAWGYYYSGQQLLEETQLAVAVALAFLVVYLMVKRWTLIQRRRLQFERAKARRAELLAHREHGSEPGTEPEASEDAKLDLDTISSQSLGLTRSVLLLTFFIALLAFWSQTQSALFSFLDSVTLWTSNQVVDGMEQTLPVTLKSFATAVVIALFSWMIARNLPGLLELVILERLELTPGTGFAITTVSKYLVYVFGVLGAFSQLGLAWSQMQWLIAALTVGLGFGLQEIFANFISGLIILAEKPIRIGDTVTIRDLSGTITKIQIRATTIEDWDRKEIIVPNKAFITEQLVNWSLSDPITRVILNIAVARDSDPALVEALLHQAVQESPLSLDDPEPEIYFSGFGSHTQDYEVRAYADEMRKRWPLRHDLHVRILAKFKDAGVVLAYPQMDLHINTKSGPDSGSLIRG